MEHKGSTPILTNLVGVPTKNIHIQFEANLCSSLRADVEKIKSPNDNDDEQRVIARVTLNHCV